MERENLVKKAKTHLRFKFEEFVSHFNKYKAVNKSANIPTDYICKDGYKLGQKINNIRSGEINLNNQQIAKLNEIGFVWNAKRVFDFEKFYNRLLNYKLRHGDLNIKRSYRCSDGYRLGDTICNVRAGNLKLSSQQRARLDEISFVWRVLPFDFDKFYQYLLKYQQKCGDVNVKQLYICDDGYKLGQKVCRIRSGGIKLTEQQKAKLNELNFVWNAKRVFDFDTFYQHLVKYKETHNDVNVGQSYVCKDNYKLGQKITNIRAGVIRLTDQQKAKLGEMGFIWDARSFNFDEFYQNLLEYLQKRKTNIVPNRYVCENGYKLGEKMAGIRTRHIKINDQQKAKLDELDFVWNVSSATKIKNFNFKHFYNQLVEYKAQNGNCFVEFDYVLSNYELGFYVRNIRNRRIRLTENQIEQLVGLGFVFNTQDLYKDKPDEPMIKRMLNGDITARNDYLNRYLPMVNMVAANYWQLTNYSDLLGVGYDGLDLALDNLKNIDETGQKRYIINTIRGLILNHIKQILSIKSMQDDVLGCEGVVFQDTIEDNTYRPDWLVEDRAFSEQLQKKARQILSNDEFKLMCLYFGFNKHGTMYTIDQLAKKFNTTPQKIEKHLQKILEKLKSNLQKDEWLI